MRRVEGIVEKSISKEIKEKLFEEETADVWRDCYLEGKVKINCNLNIRISITDDYDRKIRWSQLVDVAISLIAEVAGKQKGTFAYYANGAAVANSYGWKPPYCDWALIVAVSHGFGGDVSLLVKRHGGHCVKRAYGADPSDRTVFNRMGSPEAFLQKVLRNE